MSEAVRRVLANELRIEQEVVVLHSEVVEDARGAGVVLGVQSLLCGREVTWGGAV